MSAILRTGVIGTCSHLGTITGVSSDPKVLVKGSAILTRDDGFTVAGCTNTELPGDKPCVTVRWMTASSCIRASGRAVLLEDSQGIGLTADQVPGGLVTVRASQVAVQGRS